MPGKTQGDRLEEVQQIVTTLSARIDAINGELHVITTIHSETKNNIGDIKTEIAVAKKQISDFDKIRSDLDYIDTIKTETAILKHHIDELKKAKSDYIDNFKTDIALLKHDIEDLKKTKDEWGRRLWALVGPLIGAIIGYYLRRLGG